MMNRREAHKWVSDFIRREQHMQRLWVEEEAYCFQNLAVGTYREGNRRIQEE